MTVQQIQIKLEGMKSQSFTYADQTHLVASYKVNAIDKQFELKTNLKTFKRHFSEAENFFSRFEASNEASVIEKPAIKEEVTESLPATIEPKPESNLGIADELVKILKDNITRVKSDSKFIPQAQINNEEELKQTFQELAHAVHNMRHAQKYWQQHFGSANRARKVLWETKVDGILNRIGMAEHQNTKAIIVYKE